MHFIPIFLSLLPAAEPDVGAVESVRYLRPAGKELAVECEFSLRKTKAMSSIKSVTSRGKTRLTVSARYDDRDRLIAAEATLVSGDQKKTVNVTVSDGKATVERPGQEGQVFKVSPGVIVTSAPDWTDTFLLCRRYDRAKGGKQSFSGLWIHPEQAAHAPTFAIERIGEDKVEHAGKEMKLGRYTIWLRGNSRYAAWADDADRMIKLLPLPSKEGATNWLVLDGYEKSAGVRGLRE